MTSSLFLKNSLSCIHKLTLTFNKMYGDAPLVTPSPLFTSSVGRNLLHSCTFILVLPVNTGRCRMPFVQPIYIMLKPIMFIKIYKRISKCRSSFNFQLTQWIRGLEHQGQETRCSRTTIQLCIVCYIIARYIGMFLLSHFHGSYPCCI